MLGLVGGVFLLWLAWQTARAVPAEAAAATPERRSGLAGAYLSMLGLTLANPMTILSFGALFAGLGVTQRRDGDGALVDLGVFLGSASWWVVLTMVVGALRREVTPAWIGRINVSSGVVIGAFAHRRMVASLAWRLRGLTDRPPRLTAATGGAPGRA